MTFQQSRIISKYLESATNNVRGHIDTGHGHKLERIIIYLIMLEVFFECLHFYERWSSTCSSLPK